MPKVSPTRILRKTIKIAAWIFITFLVLFATVAITLQFPRVQTWLTGMILSQISDRVETTVTIDRVAIRFPKSVGLEGIYVEDTRGDTLLYAGSIFVDVGMTALLRSRVNVNSLELADVVFNMKRNEPDTVFNFEFLVDAFAGNEADADESTDLETAEDSGNNETDAWAVSVNRVKLSNIRYNMADHFSGLELALSFGELATHLGPADLLNEKYHTRDINLTSPHLHMTMHPPARAPEPDTLDTGMPMLDIAIDALNVSDLLFTFASHDGTHMRIGSNKLEIVPEKIELHNFLVKMHSITINELLADFNLPATEPTADNDQQSREEKPGEDMDFTFDFADIMDWNIELGRFEIKNSNFALKQEGALPQQGFDPGNMQLSNINLHMDNVVVSPHEVRMDIRETSISFSDEFRIKNLTAAIAAGRETTIRNFNLRTNDSELAFSFASRSGLLRISANDIWDLDLDLTLSQVHLKRDMAWLVPAMNEVYFNWPGNQGLKLGGRVYGKPADLNIDSLWAEGPGFFSAAIGGRVQGLPEIDSLNADIPLLSLSAIPKQFFNNFPDTLQPEGINMPAYIFLQGSARGRWPDITAGIGINSDLGEIAFQASMAGTPGEPEAFRGELVTPAFFLGHLLQMEENLPEPLAFSLVFEGEGLEPETMWLQAKTTLGNLVWNDHKYDDIILDLSIRDSVATLISNYQDDMLTWALEGSYGIFKEYPDIKINLDVPYARLDELGFSESSLLVRTNIDADLVLQPADFFNGTINITNSAVASAGEVFTLPRLTIRSTSTENDYRLQLRSSLAEADYTGNVSPASIPGILNRHFARYYELPTYNLENDTLQERYFDFRLRVNPEDLVTNILMRDIDDYDTLNLSVRYRSETRELLLNADWPGLTYGDIELSRFTADARSDEDKLEFNLGFAELSVGGIILHEFLTHGEFREQQLLFNMGFNDRDGDPLYGLAGNLAVTDSIYILTLDPESILLNGEQWNISPDNSIAFGDKHLHIRQFTLESEGRLLALSSREHEETYPILDFRFRQIDLGRLTDFSGSDFPALGGEFNGELALKNFFEEPAFLANLTIDNFAFQGDTIGDIVVRGENPRPDFFELFASLKSEVTDLVVSGNYRTGDNKGIDITAELSQLDLPSFEGFTGGNLTHLEGFLTGRMRLTGTIDEPLIDGRLNINETSFRVPAINAGYFLRSESIIFDRQQINIQGLALEDSAGRRASLNGNINFADLNQIGFNLNLTSRNFLLMNVKPGQNSMYHGLILMDTDLRLRGNQNNPTVEGRIKLNEGSNFTFVIPQTSPEAIGDEGVVEFVPFTDTLFYQFAMLTEETTPMMSSFERLDLSVNIEVDPQTDVRIIIDEFAGDFLEVQGGGVLSFGIDPGGRISLSGRYEIADGEYLLTFYDVIRRNFRIQSGSNIMWSGDPLGADVDITAIHTVRTNARELMAGLMGSDQAQSAALRQQYPFQVFLKMKGNLEEPDISFRIDLPVEHQNAMDGAIMGRLNQINQNESELNKQVFALLILGSFIQDNPFAALGGGDLSTTARSSASQILTQQLNRLSDRYVRGVEINFEVESFVDFADGQGTGRTELQMEVSRNFFDERMRITVGGNIELEDETRRQRTASDFAGDFTIEYLLTPSGNLRAKGFRIKNYADIFDGEIYETGVSLIFSRSYNRFRDLFRKEEETSVSDEVEDNP